MRQDGTWAIQFPSSAVLRKIKDHNNKKQTPQVQHLL